MKRSNFLLPVSALLVSLFTLAGCADSLRAPSSAPDANSSNPELTSGVISTANGLSVNGEAIPLQSAIVSIDGEPASPTSLQEGMRVTIEYQDGVLQSISYDEDVKGPIDIVELNGSLSVLGQTVQISSNTLFDDFVPDALKSGDIIEVSGLRDSNDVLAASRIELKQSDNKSWSVRGRVRDLDRALQTFRLGNLTVDYTQARFDEMNESALTNGLQFEIKDESRTYEPGSLYLQATKIENHDPDVRYPSSLSTSSGMSGHDSNSLSFNDSSPNGDDSKHRTEVEIDGIVTGFDAVAGTLKVEGIEILTSSETEYQDENKRYVTREDFFSRLRQGVSVVKVKWCPFIGYNQPPRELELET